MDQSRDINGQELYKITKYYSAPDFVKNATAYNIFGNENLPANIYADPLRKLFPCHTDSATWTSCAFFVEKKANFKKSDQQTIRERLNYFCKYHGIPSALNDIEKRSSSDKQTEEDLLDDDCFAVIIKTASNQKQRLYPIRNNHEINAAISYLEKHSNSIPFEYRQSIAEKIINKAAELCINLKDKQDYLDKQAGYGMCTANECAEFILDRVNASRKGPGKLSETQIEMLKMAEIIAKKPSTIRNPGSLYKVAKIIDDFDFHYNLKNESNLPKIEDIIFGITNEKMASAVKDHTTTITGNIYKLADVEKVRVKNIRDWLGDEIADSMTSDGLHLDLEKASEVIPTLPRNDAEMFDRLMVDIGCQPSAKEASHYTQEISNDYLRKLAGFRLR